MTDIQDPRDLKFEGSIQSEDSVEHKIHSTARVNVPRIPLTTGTTRASALCNSLQTQVSIPHIYNEQTNKHLTEQAKTQICQDNINPILIDRPHQISNNDYLVRSRHEVDAVWTLQQNPSQVLGALHQKEQGIDVSSQPSARIPSQAPDLCINTSHWEAVSKPPSWKSPKPKQKKSTSVSKSRSTPNKGCSSTVAFAHPESLWSVSAEEKTGATMGHNCTCSRDHCTGENSTGRMADHRTENRTEEIANHGSKESYEHVRQPMITSDCSVLTIDETDLQNREEVDDQELELKETGYDMTSNQLDTVSLNTNGNAKGKEDLKEAPVRLPSTKDASDRSPFGFFHNDKLFLFVPPSPEKEDSGTRQEADRKSKPSTRPLKLQSDQLMVTSQNLVQRIRNKSDDIPVVIVRPKRKMSNESVSSNRTSETKSRTPTKLTSQQLHVTSNGTTTINLKTGAEGSTPRSPAVNRDGSSLHLKECFIDLGTRQTLPATVQLHGDRGQLLNSAGSSQTWSTVPSTPSPGESAWSVRADIDPVIPNKPSFIIAGSDSRKKALPLLSGEKTSLLADMLLFENRGNHEGKEPITVLLQTDNSKTLLVMPKGRDKGKLDTPVTLVRKSPPKCYRDVRSDLPPTGTGNSRHGVHRNKKSRHNSVERKTTDDNCVNMHQTHSNIDLKNNARKATSKVSGNKKISQSQGQSSHETNTKDKTQNTQRGQSNFGSTHSPRLESLSLPMCLDLQHVSGIDDEPIKETVPVNLFKGIGQLFYAAGAQISTRDGRVTLRRAVFTVCFTSRDRYLRPQTGVPESLPAFVSFTPDHLVSMIFTSHLCSGFFLLEPTGQVREDPNRPEVYVESALLLPYSHRLPCPTDALFLVIGPLEEDWRSSLKVANSMSKRSVPEDVVRQLIGLEDCRCFSAITAHSETESACTGRRSLSTADFQRHRRRVEALSCSCRDCGAYARSRRGKRKLSDRVSIGSEDDSVHIKEDTTSETLASVPNSLKKKLKCKHSQEVMCGHTNTRDQTALDQGALALSILHRSGELPSGRLLNYTSPYTQSGQSSAPYEPSQEVDPVHAPALGNSAATRDLSSGEANFNLPRNQKCDKMIVKMGFPFKRISK